MEIYFYPKTIKNITTALLDMFNDIIIKKYDKSKNVVQNYIVPLQFGPLEKAQQENLNQHYYTTDNVEQGKRFYMMIPRMALILNGISYDADRAYGVNEWRYWFGSTYGLSAVTNDDVFSDYQPTPYNLEYSLSVRSDSLDYLAQILENILPYFNPKLFLRVKEFSFMNIERDLPVSVGSVAPEFIEDIGENDDRYVNATLNLTVEAFMYRPWTTSKIIHVINSQYFVRDAVNWPSTSAAPTSSYTLDNKYSTSGFDTSGGLIPSSATNFSALTPDEYNFSGHYDGGDKDFYWQTIVSGGNTI